jgi:hypothetical protein
MSARIQKGFSRGSLASVEDFAELVLLKLTAIFVDL